MKRVLPYFCIAATLLLFVSACKPPGGDKYDRAALLTNVGNNIIIPAHQALGVSAAVLLSAKASFVSNANAAQLDSLKSAYRAAYLAYQKVEAYSFSASGELRNLNAFPPDTVQISANISSGVYDLGAANNIHAKGFPALDYLLFSRNNAEIINLFTADANASKRKQYLNDIVEEINTAANSAASAWNASLSQFISASGTDVGSSIGMLVNDLSFELEKNRRERVGTALGYVGFINSGSTNPISVEAYYSKDSKELLIENLRECKRLYTGDSGNGFDDYLDYLDAKSDGQNLSVVITNQFDAAIQAAQAVPVDFSTAVATNKPEVEALFLELKKLTVLVKVDMSSALGVIINYSDNDGD